MKYSFAYSKSTPIDTPFDPDALYFIADSWFYDFATKQCLSNIYHYNYLLITWQKYQKSKTNPTRSKSDANIAASSQRYLKRRGSERHGKGAEARSRKVAFEDQREVPWWNFPMRLMKNSDVSKSTGNLLKKKRTRHSTDPESSKDQGYCPAKQNNIFRHILLLI